MKHYLKYLAAPLVVAIWSLVAAIPAEAGTPMKIWFNGACEGFGYDYFGASPPVWAESYQPQGSPICYVNNAGFISGFLGCISDGRNSASVLDHAACALMGIVVAGAVGSSITASGGTAAPVWWGAFALLSGAAAGVSYGALCYCVLHS